MKVCPKCLRHFIILSKSLLKSNLKEKSSFLFVIGKTFVLL